VPCYLVGRHLVLKRRRQAGLLPALPTSLGRQPQGCRPKAKDQDATPSPSLLLGGGVGVRGKVEEGDMRQCVLLVFERCKIESMLE
jgi:hypothetical protein